MPRRALTSLALGVAAVLGLGALPLEAPALAASRASTPPPVIVTVGTHATPGATIADDFVGLSIEANSLGTDALAPGRPGNLIGMLRSLGPGVLRIGGDSLDREVAWQSQRSKATPLSPAKDPEWAKVVLTTASLDGLKAFLDATGWRVILGLNLGHFDPQAAADEAREAVARLGSRLQGLEIGNEPNAYSFNGRRSEGWGVADYQQEVAAYRDAIRAVAPSVPLTGSASYPPVFLDAWAQVMQGQGTELTQHLYPLNACTAQTPTVEALLARGTANRSAANIRSGLASAGAAGMKLRLGESNSVICSGFYGVSDVFASSLWTVDHLLQAAQLGVSGVNLHTGAFNTCADANGSKGKAPYYALLCAATDDDRAAGQYRAQPSWYGAQLVAQLRGTSFLPTSVTGSASTVAYATTGSDGQVRVVVLDLSTHSSDSVHKVTVRLDPGFARAKQLSLTGPSLFLPSGTRLQGAAVAADGSLTPGAASTLKATNGSFSVSLKPGSAALVTAAPACSVPDLKGLIVTSAMSRLTTNGCLTGTVSKVRLKKNVRARFVVLRQHARAGSVYAPRARIGFTLGPYVAPKKKVGAVKAR